MLHPRKPEILCIRAPPFNDALRPILNQLNNGSVAMKLDQPAAIDGHRRPALRRWRQQPNKAGASQPNAAARSARGQELGAVGDEMTPTVRGDVRWWASLAETANNLDSAGKHVRRNFGGWLEYQLSGFRQQPEPFTRRSEFVANRSYTESPWARPPSWLDKRRSVAGYVVRDT